MGKITYSKIVPFSTDFICPVSSSIFTMADSSGNGNDLINTGFLISASGYNSLYSAQGDGASTWAQIPSAVFDTLTDWDGGSFEGTFSCWFKTSTEGAILGVTGGGVVPPSGPGGWVPGFYVGNDHKLQGSLFWHGAQGTTISTPSVDDGNWHLGVITFSTTAGGLESVYVDNNAADTRSGLSENGFSGSYAYTLGAGFSLTWPGFSGTNWSYFNGQIDDVRVYNSALSSTDVSNMFAGSPPSSGLVARWHFET